MITDVTIKFIFSPDNEDETPVSMTISPDEWYKIASAAFGNERASNMTKRIVNEITENIRLARV